MKAVKIEESKSLFFCGKQNAESEDIAPGMRGETKGKTGTKAADELGDCAER